MGFLSELFHSRDKPTNSTNGSAYRFLFGGSNSGKSVNERSAMQITAVYLMDAETWMDAHTAIDMGFADEILTRPAETPVENNATGPMLFSRAAVTNSLMDKLAAKCRIKKPETPERSVDTLMERLDLIKQHI